MIKKINLKYHLLFWGIYWLFQSLLMSEGHDLTFYLVKNIAMVSIQMLVVYVNWFWLFPKLFLTKKYWLYGLLSIGLIYVLFVNSFTWIEMVVGAFHQLIPSIYPMEFPPTEWVYPFWIFISSSAPYSLSLVGSLAMKIYQQNQENELLASKLKIEKGKTEIQYLRSQINPHLLFNSLNNIHTLVLTDQEKAADYTILLSDLLRYMLYEVKKERTALANELKCLADYFGLIGLRMIHPGQLRQNVTTTNLELPIVPLLLLTLVENGVKHSGIEYLEKAQLEVSIKEKGKQLVVQMKNSIAKEHPTTDQQGIGLDNLKKRLVLNYPNKHQFTFRIEDKIAYTELHLNLQS